MIEQVAKLANAGILVLDKPAAVDDGDAVAKARNSATCRKSVRRAIWLLPPISRRSPARTPAEPPSGDNERCTLDWTDAGGLENEFTLQVQWRDGFRKFETEQAESSVAGGDLGSVTAAGGEKTNAADGPWDAMAETFIGVMAVKQDVWLNIETGGVANDTATAFIRPRRGSSEWRTRIWPLCTSDGFPVEAGCHSARLRAPPRRVPNARSIWNNRPPAKTVNGAAKNGQCQRRSHRRLT